MTLNRELPPDEHLPEGATPLRSDDNDEQIASQIALAAAGEPDERYDEDGQVGVVFRFVAAMREGRYEDGLKLAHEDWLLSRVQAWLWNTRPQDRDDKNALLQSAESLADRQSPTACGRNSSSPSAHSSARRGWTWPQTLGAQRGRRRRISADCDLVIIAPVGDTGGYYVASATILPNAMTFVVRRTDSGWKIANHIGAAPATPGMPPAWWISDDPALEALDQTDAVGPLQADQNPSVERHPLTTGLNRDVARSGAGTRTP